MAIMVKAKAKASDVPDGIYKAVLAGVKTFSNSFGERVGFEFELVEGEHKGAVLMRSTSPVLGSKQGNLYAMLKGLLGRELTQSELEGGLDVEALVGTICTILVTRAQNKQGQTFSNIDRVMQL